MPTLKGTGQLTLTDMNDVVAQATAPTSPTEGALWWNTIELQLYIYQGGVWKKSTEGLIIGSRNLITDSKVRLLPVGVGSTRVSTSLKDSQEYTFSGDYEIVSGTPTAFLLYPSGTSNGSYPIAIPTTPKGKMKMTFTPTSTQVPNLNIYSGRTNAEALTTDVIFTNLKLEIGSLATDWTPAPEDIDDAITDIELTLGNMANDNILDFAERQVVKDKIADIIGYVLADATTTMPTTATNDAGTSGKGTFYNVRKGAVMAGLSVTDARYVAVLTTYNALKTYLEALTPIDPWDLRTTTQDTYITVVKDTFRTNWLNYYKAELDLTTATAEKLKQNVDDVEVGGANYASNGNFAVIDLTKPLWSASYAGQVKEVVDISAEKPPFRYAYHVKNTTNANGGIFSPILWDGLIAEAMVDKQITVSFWLRYQNIVVGAVASSSGRFGEIVIEGTTATATKVYSYPRFATPTTTTEVAYIAGTNTVWAKYSATFKLSLPATATKLSKISFKHGLENCTGEFWTTGIMIETGNKASDWSHSPLDLQERLNSVEFKITDSEILSTVTSSDDYIALKAQSSTTAGAITSKVSQTEVNVSIANDKQIRDTRTTNELPSYYWTNFPRQTIEEFKTKAVIGVTGGSATYGNLTTETPWSDSSGGAIKQTFASADGTFERRGTSTTVWTAWVQIEDTVGSQAKINAFNTSTVVPLATRVSTAETKITPSAIVSTVTQSTDYVGLVGRMDTAETKITPTAITNTVTSSTTYINAMGAKVATNAIISSINQTAEAIKISATKIDITGAVTFSSFDTSTKGILSNSNGAIINDNPNFLDWTGTNPAGYSQTAVTGLTKVASGNGMGNAVQFAVTAGTNSYLTPTVITTHPYYQYLVVDFIFNLTSGTIGGAGVMVRYNATSLIDNNIPISSAMGTPVLNKWYTVTKVIKVASATPTAGFTGYSVFPMGAFTALGAITTKTIQFDSLKIRPASEQEINAYETGINVTTNATKWNTASTDATASLTKISDMSNDAILSPTEKTTVKKEFEIIVGEKIPLETQATTYEITTEKTAYTDAHLALSNYINPLLVSMTSNSAIVGVTFRNHFKTYYVAKVNLIKKITDITGSWKKTGKTTIDGGKIEADSVTATQISVTSLDALSANLGTMTAGKIQTLQIAGGVSNQIVFGDSIVNFEGRIDYTGDSLRFQSDASTYLKVNKAGASGTATTDVTPQSIYQMYLAGSPAIAFGIDDSIYKHRMIGGGTARLKFLNSSTDGIQVRNALDTGYVDVYANNFTMIGKGDSVGENQIASGSVSVTPVANTYTSVNVSFGKSLRTIPHVTATAATTVPGTPGVAEVTVSNVTVSGCTLWIMRSNTVATIINYVALGL